MVLYCFFIMHVERGVWRYLSLTFWGAVVAIGGVS